MCVKAPAGIRKPNGSWLENLALELRVMQIAKSGISKDFFQFLTDMDGAGIYLPLLCKTQSFSWGLLNIYYCFPDIAVAGHWQCSLPCLNLGMLKGFLVFQILFFTVVMRV